MAFAEKIRKLVDSSKIPKKHRDAAYKYLLGYVYSLPESMRKDVNLEEAVESMTIGTYTISESLNKIGFFRGKYLAPLSDI